MKSYTGTKLTALPMNKIAYCRYRNWPLPVGEDGADDGYLVEHPDGSKPNDSRHANFISWISKEIFDLAYSVGAASIEKEVQAKGLTAPRVTPADVQASIASEHYFTASDGVTGDRYKNSDDDSMCIDGFHVGEKDYIPSLGLLTFCVVVLKNGFTVTGESACASPENFNAETGRKIARQNAEQKIWSLMGYELKTLLARPVLTEADADADLAGTPRPSKHG